MSMEAIIVESEKVLQDLQPLKKELYLFVCSGNTCRSPMAAALFNHF